MLPTLALAQAGGADLTGQAEALAKQLSNPIADL
jgi:hypothetical protein